VRRPRTARAPPRTASRAASRAASHRPGARRPSRPPRRGSPFIYENADAFNDVTSGSGSGCSFGDGWPATKGWDAVTGVGTPNYEKLAKAVAALP